ncbi:uncharacterized protein LOC121897596 [Scomber scombrus]|uniref:Uncharacterized protein LOC121897596 n=1 Tax=Scomber scombrus TaxID=13677 RepID=A0AAV1PH62_SCOSC
MEITFDTFCPLIQTFFGEITEGQWILLSSGSPDNATKILLGVLLLDLKQAATNTLLKNTTVVIFEEQLKSKLGDMLAQSLVKVMGVKDLDKCVSFHRLTSLLAKEVIDSSNFPLFTARIGEPAIDQRLIHIHRLNDMIRHAIEIMETCTSKTWCRPRAHRERVSQTTLPCSTPLVLQDLEEIDDSCQSLVKTEETPEDQVTSAKEAECFTSATALASKCEEVRFQTSQGDARQAERNKTLITILLENIIFRVVNKAKVNWRHSEVIIHNLFKSIWADIEEAKFPITPATLKELDEAVFKDLVKKWGSAETVLILMTLEEPVTVELMASCISARLMAPVKERKSAISRVFSLVEKCLPKPFKRSCKVGVL